MYHKAFGGRVPGRVYGVAHSAPRTPYLDLGGGAPKGEGKRKVERTGRQGRDGTPHFANRSPLLCTTVS